MRDGNGEVIIMNSITQEERKRIIEELKGDSEEDSVCTIRNILFNRKGRCGNDMSCQECHKKIREKLLDLIDSTRNLSMNDIIPRPWDVDGRHIKFNDIVYYDNDDKELKVFGYKFVKDTEFCIIMCVGRNKSQDEYGYFDKFELYEYPSNKLSHKKPQRTLEKIKEEVKDKVFSYDEEVVDALIQEVYELGRSNGMPHEDTCKV